MQIHIIGQGRLGRSLAHILSQQSIQHEIYGRTFPTKMNGLVYICVSEASIGDVAQQLTYHDNVCILHASGSLGLDVFPDPNANIACLHPIQSFPGPEIHLPESIPATLECGQCTPEGTRDTILTFANQLGFTVYPFIGDRLAYHTAAVLSGNFTTILFSLAKELLTREGYDDDMSANLLYSLANQSLSNAKHGFLKDVLTGPIARKQSSLIDAQQENLDWDADLSELYKLFVRIANKRL